MEPLTSAKLISAVATANLVWIAFMTVSPFFYADQDVTFKQDANRPENPTCGW